MEPITNIFLASIVQVVQIVTVTNVTYPGSWQQTGCPEGQPGCAVFHSQWVQDANPSWRTVETETLREFVVTVKEWGLASTNRVSITKSKPRYEILGKNWVEAPSDWEPPHPNQWRYQNVIIEAGSSGSGIYVFTNNWTIGSFSVTNELGGKP